MLEMETMFLLLLYLQLCICIFCSDFVCMYYELKQKKLKKRREKNTHSAKQQQQSSRLTTQLLFLMFFTLFHPYNFYKSYLRVFSFCFVFVNTAAFLFVSVSFFRFSNSSSLSYYAKCKRIKMRENRMIKAIEVYEEAQFLFFMFFGFSLERYHMFDDTKK